MMNLKKEYNEFGPWLSEITGEEDVTHQFAHLTKEIVEAELAVKVPVDKEWRNVKEGELLYDTVMSLDKETVSCHRIIEGVAYSCKLVFKDIQFVRIFEELLSYNIEIGTELETIHVQSINIPSQLADRFVKMLIEKFVACNKGTHIEKLKKDKITLHYKEGIEISEALLVKETSMAR